MADKKEEEKLPENTAPENPEATAIDNPDIAPETEEIESDSGEVLGTSQEKSEEIKSENLKWYSRVWIFFNRTINKIINIL
jgi:hypothetical protein